MQAKSELITAVERFQNTVIKKRVESKSRKQQTWQEIKKLAPEVAEHIKIVKETFDMPRYLSVRYQDKEIINTWPHRDDRRNSKMFSFEVEMPKSGPFECYWK